MSLEDVYYLGQTVAVFAILVSLLALLYQARLATLQFKQANLQARAEYSRDFANRLSDLQLAWFGRGFSGSTIHKALLTAEPLDKAEQLEFSTEMAILFSQLMSAEQLLEQGLIDVDYAQTRNLILEWYLQFPRVRNWWQHVPDGFFPSRRFCYRVERTLEQTDAAIFSPW